MPPKAPPRRGAASGTASTRPAAASNTNAPQQPVQPGAGGAGAGAGATRPPVQRLQTLKKRAPSASIGAGGAGPGPGAARATPGPAGPGDPPKPTLKYKPRAVGRRSKEERDAIEKLEAQRHRERLAEAAAIQRGRGGPAGGRGGASGRGRGGAFGGAAGPLGAGFGAGGARRGRGGRFGGGHDSRQSSMSVRSRSIIDLGSGGGGMGAGEDVSSDESDNEVRVCIDRINLESDEEGGDAPVEGKKGKAAVKYADTRGGERGLRPVRVERQEHAERVVSVNMESSSSKSAELREKAKKDAAAVASGDDALFVPEEPRVKEEPVEDGDQVMTGVAPYEVEAGHDDGFLPKQKVKVRRKLSREPTTPPEPADDETADAAPDGEAGVAPVPADPKSLLRTKEDIEEYERHEKDLELVRELLRHEEKEPATKATEPRPEGEGEASATATAADGDDATTETAAADGEKEKDADEEAEDDKLAGHLFLVQFPPITPNLIVPGENANPEAGAEPTTTTAPEGNTSQPPTDTPVKREEDEVLDDADSQADTQPPSQVVTATDWGLRAGRVGKLNVHASGRVTMNWGGISFELDRATAVDFLQEALIVSTPPGTTEEIPEDEKKVWAMGQLSGKFTVTPDWGAML